MVSKPDNSSIEAHNREQRQYYQQAVKSRLLPRESRYTRRHIQEVLRAGKITKGMRVLEIGCGMGRYTLSLAKMGIQIEGLDLTPFLLEKLAEFNGGRYAIPVYCADVLNYPSSLEGRFDAVIGFFVLHHLHDLELSFLSMARLVKPGGSLVFVEPNPLNPLFYVQILCTPKMSWKGDRGILNMRPEIVGSAMRKAGMDVNHVERFGFFPPFLANNPLGARMEPLLERIPIWRTFLPFQLFVCRTN